MSARRPRPGLVAAASAAVLALVGTALPAAAADPSPPAPAGTAKAAASAVIGSDRLSVAVADDFPRVLSYTDRASGEQLLGSVRPVTEVTLNGTARPVKLKGKPKFSRSTARYTLVFDSLPGGELHHHQKDNRPTTTNNVNTQPQNHPVTLGHNHNT
ncbi:hypothetical protein ACFVDN_07360, partial [Streptomyces californicus]